MREQLLHRGKTVKDTGFDNLLRAFDLFDEGSAQISKETQTERPMIAQHLDEESKSQDIQAAAPDLPADNTDIDHSRLHEESQAQKTQIMEQTELIQTLETEKNDLQTQVQKLQTQLKSANIDKDRLVKEKSDLEARLRHEMAEKIKQIRDKGQ